MNTQTVTRTSWPIYYVLTIFTLLTHQTVTAQSINRALPSDMDAAKWMVDYSRIRNHFIRNAYNLVPNIRENSKNIICIQDRKEHWHLFVKYVSSGEQKLDHYLIDKNLAIRKSSRLHFAGMAATIDEYYSALLQVSSTCDPITGTLDISVESFVSIYPDNTFRVILVPANRSEKYLLYGLELNYVVDTHRQKIVRDDSYFSGGVKFRILNTPYVFLNYTDTNTLPLSAVYLGLCYRNMTRYITFTLDGGTCTLVPITESDYSWSSTFDQ